ncbi:hypothetical protein HanIR_Chr13g0654391 [Helianthus annuus]|nr:hypothetical protein HanIR_Chr13g0654391 [Helianthus annuus]
MGLGRNMGHNNRKPTCQLGRITGHYISQCFQLASFAASTSLTPHQLAHAFHAQCHINSTVPDWTSDMRATTHMLPNNYSLQNSTPTQGNQNVYFGNRQALPIG